jgi:hypothetical protein
MGPATMKDNAHYDLFYDSHLITTVTRVDWDAPPMHCTHGQIAPQAQDSETGWAVSLDKYIGITREAHRLQMLHEHAQSDELLRASKDFLATFGSHLWYLVQKGSGIRTKIKAPLFGVDSYLQLLLSPTKVHYDPVKLQTMLQTRIVLLLSTVAVKWKALNAQQVEAHLLCLSQCLQLTTKLTQADDEPNKRVELFFQKLDGLDSPIEIFHDPNFHRKLDQACALDL